MNDTSDIGLFQLASHIQKQVVSHNKIHSKKNQIKEMELNPKITQQPCSTLPSGWLVNWQLAFQYMHVSKS